MNEIHISHSTWNCKYHIVFAPKHRRKVFYDEKCYEIGKLLKEDALSAQLTLDLSDPFTGGQ